MAMADQQEIFRKRLKRIDSGQGNTMGRIHCGIEEIATPREKNLMGMRSGGVGVSILGALIKIPLGLVIAATLGVVGTILARIGVYQGAMASEVTLAGQSAMMADVGVGILVSLLLCFILGFRKNYHMVAAAVGACAVIGGMHNLVHMSPDLWTKAFSQEWVDNVMTTTSPDSFDFGALSMDSAA